jgi:hypothetical protein
VRVDADVDQAPVLIEVAAADDQSWEAAFGAERDGHLLGEEVGRDRQFDTAVGGKVRIREGGTTAGDGSHLVLNSTASNPLWVLPTTDAAQQYAGRSGIIDISRLDWYLAFATWRTAVVIQQLSTATSRVTPPTRGWHRWTTRSNRACSAPRSS